MSPSESSGNLSRSLPLDDRHPGPLDRQPVGDRGSNTPGRGILGSYHEGIAGRDAMPNLPNMPNLPTLPTLPTVPSLPIPQNSSLGEPVVRPPAGNVAISAFMNRMAMIGQASQAR